MTTLDLDKLEANVNALKHELRRLRDGDPVTLRIPAQPDDWDSVLSRGLESVAALIRRIRELEGDSNARTGRSHRR